MLGRKTKIGAGLALAFAGALVFSGCAGGSTATPETTTEASEAPMASETPMETMDPAADLVGSGCAAYAEAVPSGAGSVEGMSQDPVATAASNNPLLTQLVALVGQAGLVDTLNSPTAEYTVFAPVDDAFDKLDEATVQAVTSDNALLTSVLTYHVLPERLNPDEIDGTFATVQGADLTVTGSGDNIVVNGNSAVICGGVQTANATVYLIDTVLMPPM